MEFQNKDNEYFSSSEIKNDSQEFFSYRADTNEKKHNDLKKVNCHLRMAAMILSGGIVIFAGYSTDKNSEPVTIIAESENPQTKVVESQREIEVINEINESINHDDITLSDEEIIYIQNIIEALESENYEDVLNLVNRSSVFEKLYNKINMVAGDRKVVLLDPIRITSHENGKGIYFSYIDEGEYLYYGNLQNDLADGNGIKFERVDKNQNTTYSYHKGRFKFNKANGEGISCKYDSKLQTMIFLQGNFTNNLADGEIRMIYSSDEQYIINFKNGICQIDDRGELLEDGKYMVDSVNDEYTLGFNTDIVENAFVE